MKKQRDITATLKMQCASATTKAAKGITLVALVLTVIIIIILATVTINFIFGENGLVERAEQAKLEQEIAKARETLTMILGDAFVEKKLNPEYDQSEFLDKFIEAREPNVYLEEDEIGLNGHIFGLDRSVPELGEYQGELTEPRIKEIKVLEETTNSASIEVVARNAEGATYTYSYKNNNEGDGQWKEVETDNKSNTCTINGLTQGETYNIKVVVTTSEGSATGEINVYLGEIPEETITFTPTEWVGDGTATTTINTSEEGYTLQYQIVVGEGKIVDTNWKTATPGQTIEGLHHNETVYGRLWDGTNESKDYASMIIKDTTPPTKPTINTNGYVSDTWTKDNVTLSFDSQDKEIGIWKYQWTPDGNVIHDVTNPYVWSENTRTGFFVRAVDYAGNVSDWSNPIIISKDSLAPNDFNISIDNVTTDGFTIHASTTDAGPSGINRYDYIVNGEIKYSGANTSFTLNGLKAGTNYEVYVNCYDNAGNIKNSSTTVTTKELTITDILKEGNYVKYSDGTNVERICIVLYDNSSGYGIQIIPKGTIGSATIGASSFNESINYYNSAITLLNNATQQYLNNTYASSVRCVGSVPNNPYYEENTYYSTTISYMVPYNGKFKNDDSNYLTDYNQMVKLNINNIGDIYWLSSRVILPDPSSYTHCSVRCIDSSGNLFNRYMCKKGTSWTEGKAWTESLRPVFTLKPNIKVTGGSGTSEDPYTLGT